MQDNTRWIRWLGGLLLVAGCCGCGGLVRFTPLTSDSVVLAFGDSLTAGTGAEEEEAYPAVLASLLGCKVVNAGVPGERSDEGLDRLASLLKRHKPALVILCHGGNDMLQKSNESDIADNLRAMIGLVQSSGADVLLLGVPKPGLFLKAPRFYAEVAKASQVAYDGKILPGILSAPSLKSDLIHPNADGYRKLAERVAALVRKHS